MMMFHGKPCSKSLWRAKQNSQEIPPATCGNRHAIGHAVAKYVWIAGYVCETRSHQYRGSTCNRDWRRALPKLKSMC